MYLCVWVDDFYILRKRKEAQFSSDGKPLLSHLVVSLQEEVDITGGRLSGLHDCHTNLARS